MPQPVAPIPWITLLPSFLAVIAAFSSASAALFSYRLNRRQSMESVLPIIKLYNWEGQFRNRSLYLRCGDISNEGDGRAKNIAVSASSGVGTVSMTENLPNYLLAGERASTSLDIFVFGLEPSTETPGSFIGGKVSIRVGFEDIHGNRYSSSFAVRTDMLIRPNTDRVGREFNQSLTMYVSRFDIQVTSEFDRFKATLKRWVKAYKNFIDSDPSMHN